MVLGSGCLRRTKVFTFLELWGKRSSFPIAYRLQTDEIIRLLLQEVTVERLSLHLKRWRLLTTWNHTEASRRWTAKYYIAFLSNSRYLMLVDSRCLWRAWLVRGWVCLGKWTTRQNSWVFITLCFHSDLEIFVPNFRSTKECVTVQGVYSPKEPSSSVVILEKE